MDVQETNKCLEKNLAQTLENSKATNHRKDESTQGVGVKNDSGNESTLIPTNNEEKPKVIIFHDSLCKGIKDAMMVKEKVNIKKRGTGIGFRYSGIGLKFVPESGIRSIFLRKSGIDN